MILVFRYSENSLTIYKSYNYSQIIQVGVKM